MVTNDLDQFAGANGSYGDYMLVLSNGTDKWEYAKELSEIWRKVFLHSVKVKWRKYYRRSKARCRNGFSTAASCYDPDYCQSDLYSGPAGTASHRFTESQRDDILADIEDSFVEELPFGSCREQPGAYAGGICDP